nr:putative amino-acid permease [Quercus suber]
MCLAERRGSSHQTPHMASHSRRNPLQEGCHVMCLARCARAAVYRASASTSSRLQPSRYRCSPRKRALISPLQNVGPKSACRLPRGTYLQGVRPASRRGALDGHWCKGSFCVVLRAAATTAITTTVAPVCLASWRRRGGEMTVLAHVHWSSQRSFRRLKDENTEGRHLRHSAWTDIMAGGLHGGARSTDRKHSIAVADEPVTSVLPGGDIPINDSNVKWNADEEVLAALGYKPEFKREFNLWTTFCVSFAVLGLLPSFATTLFYGMGYAGTAGMVRRLVGVHMRMENADDLDLRHGAGW